MGIDIVTICGRKYLKSNEYSVVVALDNIDVLYGHPDGDIMIETSSGKEFIIANYSDDSDPEKYDYMVDLLISEGEEEED